MGWNPFKDARDIAKRVSKYNPLGPLNPITVGLFDAAGKKIGALPKDAAGNSPFGPVGTASLSIAQRKGPGMPKIDGSRITIGGPGGIAERFNPANQQANPLFGRLRQRAEADISSRMNRQGMLNKQFSDDAIARRMAAQGGLNSGAFLKFGANQRNLIDQQTRDAINDSLNQTNMALDQAEIQSGEADKQRYASMAESDANREMQRAVQQADVDFRNKVYKFEAGSKLRELDMAQKELEIDALTTEFNKRVAEAEAGKKPPGLLDQLFNIF